MKSKNRVSEKDFNEIVGISALIELIENTYNQAKKVNLEERTELCKDIVFGYVADEFKKTWKESEKYQDYRQGNELRDKLKISYTKLVELF